MTFFAGKRVLPLHPHHPERVRTEADVRPAAKAETILISIGDVMRPVNWREIVSLAADGNYVRIFMHGKDYFHHRSLGSLLAELGEERFVRIHRSWAVNIAEIASVRPLAKGAAELRLRNGQKLRMSRRFKSAVRRTRALAALMGAPAPPR